MVAPKYVKVMPENVPKSLQELKMWTVWKSIDKKDGNKPSKVPHYNHYNENTGKSEARFADLHNPNHLMTFEEAIKMLTANGSKFSGIQLVLDFDKELGEDVESKSMNITPHVVKQLLKKHGFVERKMQKAVTMKDCKDRNEQFEKIHELKEEYSKSENPIISMDVKKRVFR